MQAPTRDHYATMPYPERCQQTSDLLTKAVIGRLREQRLQRSTVPAHGEVPQKLTDLTVLVSDEIEKQIIRHLMVAGDAAPLEFCAAFHISPATAFRKLARLRTTGLVSVMGKSRAARYRLSGPSDKN